MFMCPSLLVSVPSTLVKDESPCNILPLVFDECLEESLPLLSLKSGVKFNSFGGTGVSFVIGKHAGSLVDT